MSAEIANRTCRVQVERCHTHVDGLFSYWIFLDVKKAGRVRTGETTELEVSPGAHSIVVKMGWCSSETLPFEVQAKQSAHFKCCNRPVPKEKLSFSPHKKVFRISWSPYWKTYHTFFRPQEYLKLKQVSPETWSLDSW